MRKTSEFLIVLFAILFTKALIYIILEVPRIINELLLSYGFFRELDIEVIRPLGYVLFMATLILMFAGFEIKRGWLTALGFIALYLPTFGCFAFSMTGFRPFFLAGIGILRVMWIPLFDFSKYIFPSQSYQTPYMFGLGDIVYLPYIVLKWLLAPGPPKYINYYSVNYEMNFTLSFIAMQLGLFVFLLSTLAWLYGRFKGFHIINFWIYKYSRHPQYLGLLLWSYGLLLLARSFGGAVPPPSFLFLISSLTIVGVALFEENIMVKKHGEEYIRYREKTPFMLPLPKQLSALIMALNKRLLKKDWPESGKEVAYIIIIYGAVFVLLSLAFRSILPFLIQIWYGI